MDTPSAGASLRSRRLPWWAPVVALGLVGCGGPPPPPPVVVTEVQPEPAPAAAPAPPPRVYDSVRDPEVYLAEGFAERERRRALMKRVGDLFWDLESAEGGYVDLRGKPDQPVYWPQVVVAERHARHLRVVRESGGLRATYYLAATDFHDLAARRATLLDNGGEPFAGGCGVTVPAGAQLEARAPHVGFRRVALRRAWIAAEGVLAERDVDVVYRLEAPPDDEDAGAGEPCKIRSPFTVRDGPDGRVVAEILGDGLHFCTASDAARGGARRIAFTYDETSVVGHVPAAKVEPRDPPSLGPIGTIGRGSGTGWAASHTTYLYLSPGDAIFAPAHHLRIATVVDRDFKVGDEGEEEGWHRVRFPFQLWDFDVFHITPATAKAGGERAVEVERGG